ncbi:MAG: ribonuclease HII [Bacteriovoracaceae bacterium]
MFDLKFLQKNKIKFPLTIFACDEVGRGPLAGPVVAACIKIDILSEAELKKFLIFLQNLSVTDSKKLKSLDRRNILEKLSIDWTKLSAKRAYQNSHNGFSFSFALEEIDNYEIDQINILQASLKAMKTSFEILFKEKNHMNCVVLIDGNRSFKSDLKAELFPIIKGDANSFFIGLASIIAKEYRDSLMVTFDTLYPSYGFVTNMGYPSLAHRNSLILHGPTPIHRLSFAGVIKKSTKPKNLKKKVNGVKPAIAKRPKS